MKVVKTAVLLALSSVVLVACASSEHKDTSDDNDTSDSSQSAEDAATTSSDDEDPSGTGSRDSSADDAANEDEAIDAANQTDVNSDVTTDAGAGEVDADADEVSEVDADAGACLLPEAEPPSCEACLADECEDQYKACYCDEDCTLQLDALRACFAEANTFDDPSEDPAADWNECMDAIGGDDASPLLFEVLSCAGEYYQSPEEDAEDDPYARFDGDAVCTSACFSLFNFDEL